MRIPDNKYDALLAYIESGAQGNLSPELVEYIELLDVIRSMYARYRSRDTIINFLQKPPYTLSYYAAVIRFSEAINFFYLDNDIKKKAWRNVYAERLDKVADLALKASTSILDLEIYKKIIDAAARMRQLDKPDPPELPSELFTKPFKIYTLNPEDIGRTRADRNLLAKHIDELDIPEKDKDRVRADAGLTEINLFEDDQDQEDKTEE